MPRKVNIDATIETTPLTVAVTAAPGGAGTAVAYNTASSRVILTNTSVSAAVQYKVGSGAWNELEQHQGAHIDIDMSATSLYLRRAALDGGLAEARLVVEGVPVLSYGAKSLVDAGGSSGITVTGTPGVGNVLTAAFAMGVGTVKWQDSPDGTTWTDISSATNMTFTLTSAQSGKRVRPVATSYAPFGASVTVPGSALRQLLYASSINKFPTTSSALTGTQLSAFFCYDVYIGGDDQDSLALLLPNIRLGTSGPAINNTNTVTITDLVLESANSNVSNQCVRVTVAGANGVTLSASEVGKLSDEIFPTAFGATKFTQGDKYRVRGILNVPAAGNTLMTSRRYNEGDGADMSGTVKFRCWTYDPAVTTPGSIMTPGNWGSTPTVTGTAATPIASQFGYCPILLGRNRNAGKSADLILGDSLNDASLGFIRAALLASSKGMPALCEYAISGGHQSDFTWLGTETYQYANRLVCTPGINNSTDTSASFSVYWPKARAGGIQKIIRTKLTPSVTTAQYSTTSVTYAYDGTKTVLTVQTAAALPPVGQTINVAGATPAGLNTRHLVISSGSGQFTCSKYGSNVNTGTGTATGTIIWGNDWNVEADQSYSDGGAAGNQGAFNNAMVAYKNAGTIDALLDLASIRASGDFYKFKGQLGQHVYDTWVNSTTIGRHFTGADITAITAEIAPILDAIVVT